MQFFSKIVPEIFSVLGIAFFLISVVFSMFGLGGGTLYVPILLFFSFSYSVSAGTSLLLILVGAASAAIIYARSGMIHWEFVLAVNFISDLGAFFGGYYSSLFNPHFLRILFSLVLIASGTLLIKDISPAFLKPFGGRLFIWNHRFRDRSYPICLPLIVGIFIVVGFWSGVLGIGGGVFKIPLMVIACGFPLKEAVATSSLMVAMSSFWGVAGHLSAGSLNMELAAPLAVLVFLGGQIGSRISIRTRSNRLRWGLSVVLYLIALIMVASVFFPG